MKKIWVPKRCLESLQVNVLMTPPVKNRNPRSNYSYVPKYSYGSKSSYGSNSSYVSKSSKGIRLFVMCLKSRSSTGTLEKRVLPLRGNSMLMVHIGSLSSTPKPHGLLQRDLQLIHLTYLALHVNLLILLMSHLTPTINC